MCGDWTLAIYFHNSMSYSFLCIVLSSIIIFIVIFLVQDNIWFYYSIAVITTVVKRKIIIFFSGIVQVRINKWVLLSFCLPHKAHQIHNRGLIIEPETIDKCVQKLRPYHGILLMVSV